MNRQVTGWLAWSTLALVISVPSAELVFPKSDSDAVLENISVADISMDKLASSGQLPRMNVDVFEAPIIKRIALNKPVVDEAVPAAPFGPPLPIALETGEIRSAELAALPRSSFEDVVPQIAPKAPVGSPMPIEFRLVGEQRVLTAELMTDVEIPYPVLRQNDQSPVIQPRKIRVVGDKGMALIEAGGTENIVETALVSIPSEATETNGAEKTAPEVVQVAMVDEVQPLFNEPEIVAPIPMPAYKRPAVPQRETVASVSTDSFVEDVRASIGNIRRAKNVPVQPIVFHDLPNREADLGYDPQFNERSQRPDTFPFRDFQRNDYAGDSEFYELWAEGEKPAGFSRFGSFSEQFPARRGNGIRLDLVN